MRHLTDFFPKPPILAEIDRRHPAVIEASAGTGKTYTLEHLVVDLIVSSPAQLDELLVVTFTEKAALELRARLRRKLRSMLEPSPYRDEEQISNPHGWFIDPPKRRKIDEALRRFDAACISTIHAFCHRTLAEQSFSHGRLFGERLVDTRSVFDEAFLGQLRTTFACREPWRSFLRAWLSRSSVTELQNMLFECHAKRGQFEVVLDLDKLLAKLQSAQRLDLAPQALRPAFERARLPSSTARALIERLARLRALLKSVQSREHVAASLAALEEEDARPGGAFQFILERIHGKSAPGSLLHRLEHALVEIEQTRVSLPSAMVQLFLPEILAEAHRLKQRRGELDFDDMLALLAGRVSSVEGQTLVDQLRARFRFALIDEFQDTDETQWEIFRKVFVEACATHSLFVIGDPKQAIYGFRGADVETYRGACAQIASIGGPTIPLSQNHRSTPALVDAINQILDQSAKQPFFTGANAYPNPVTSANQGLGSIVRGNKVLAPVHIFHVTSPEGQLTAREARTTLARRIADEIHELIHDNTTLTRTRPHTKTNTPPMSPDARNTTPSPDAKTTESRRLEARDIFILTRSAREGIEVAEHLRREGVPHAFYKQDGLFQTREAHDIRAVFRAIQEPTSRSRRLYAWQTAFFSVEIAALGSYTEVPADAPMFAQLLEWQKLAEANQYSRLFTRLLEDTHLIERELFLGAGERKITNYGHILEHLLEETFRRKVTLVELIRCLDEYIEGRRHPPGEDGNIQRLETDRDAVQIMTMHKSKGLEAPVVFLFGGFDAPAARASIYHRDGRRYLTLGDRNQASVEQEREEEDQRLLYVAMTRAGARLYLPYFAVADTSKAGDAVRGRARDLSQLEGPYRVLNQRLDDVVQPGMDPTRFRIEEIMVGAHDSRPRGDESTRESRDTREDRETREYRNAREETDVLGDFSTRCTLAPSSPTTIHPWTLPPELRAGHLITSYSRIKAAKGGYTPPSSSAESSSARSDADFVPPTTHSSPDAIPQADLPGGPVIGRLLHSLLEEVPLETVRSSTRSDFCQAPEVRSLVARVFERYGQAEVHFDRALELVYSALTTPMSLGSTRLEHGLVSCPNLVREMAFLYPIDTSERQEAGIPPGFMKGFIDLVVEMDGRYFLIDWKSDLLPTYDEAQVAAHVAHNYTLQADVYALALTKHLGIRDASAFDACFGGIAYCFIRGMHGSPSPSPAQQDPTPGVYFARPAWTSLVDVERHLKTMSNESGS